MGSLEGARFTSEPIAIIGLSCKFAGDARNSEALWQMLAEKRSAWSGIPPSRFNARGSYHPNPEKPSTVCNRCNSESGRRSKHTTDDERR